MGFNDMGHLVAMGGVAAVCAMVVASLWREYHPKTEEKNYDNYKD